MLAGLGAFDRTPLARIRPHQGNSQRTPILVAWAAEVGPSQVRPSSDLREKLIGMGLVS